MHVFICIIGTEAILFYVGKNIGENFSQAIAWGSNTVTK